MTRSTKQLLMVMPMLLVLLLASGTTADAQRFHGRVGYGHGYGYGYRPIPRWSVNLGYYDPFWFPYGFYPYVVEHPTAAVNIDVVPKQAEVFVDGYFAGKAGKVRTTPGGHAITLFLPGYRTMTQDVYVSPGSTVKLRDSMDRLAAGEVSAPPPAPAHARRHTAPENPAPQG
jgi:hypothetical protein